MVTVFSWMLVELVSAVAVLLVGLESRVGVGCNGSCLSYNVRLPVPSDYPNYACKLVT